MNSERMIFQCPFVFMGISFIDTHKVSLKYATKYGKAMKEDASKCFIKYARMHHDGFALKDTGLHVLKDNPYHGAVPDGLAECNSLFSICQK